MVAVLKTAYNLLFTKFDWEAKLSVVESLKADRKLKKKKNT